MSDEVQVDPEKLRKFKESLEEDIETLRNEMDAVQRVMNSSQGHGFGGFPVGVQMERRHQQAMGAMSRLMQMLHNGVETTQSKIEQVATNYEETDEVGKVRFEEQYRRFRR